MRHFLTQKFVPEAFPVPRLPHRLQSSRPRLDPVRGSRTTDRLTAPRRSALVAQTLTPIAATADSKLDSTPLADREPVL
jgi:hypothetical protein